MASSSNFYSHVPSTAATAATAAAAEAAEMCKTSGSNRRRGGKRKHHRLESTTSSPENQLFSSPDFYSGMATAAVAYICKSTGFSSARRSAIQVFAGVAALHLQYIAGRAASRAAACRRTEINVFDFLHAVDSAAVSVNPNIPIYAAADDFTVSYSPIEDSAASLGEICRRRKAPASSHIPPWLPEIPDSALLSTDLDQKCSLTGKRYGEWIDCFGEGTIDGMNRCDFDVTSCISSCSELPVGRTGVRFSLKMREQKR